MESTFDYDFTRKLKSTQETCSREATPRGGVATLVDNTYECFGVIFTVTLTVVGTQFSVFKEGWLFASSPLFTVSTLSPSTV